MNTTSRFLSQVLVCTLVLCALGPIAITPQIAAPITLQSLIVILLPVLVGWRAGVTAIVLYLLIGASGLPVFANFNSGLAPFRGASAGFLFGFPVVGFLAGWWSARKVSTYWQLVYVFLVCHVLLLFFGMLGFLLAGLAGEQISYTLISLLPGLFAKSLAGGLFAFYLRKVATFFAKTRSQQPLENPSEKANINPINNQVTRHDHF